LESLQRAEQADAPVREILRGVEMRENAIGRPVQVKGMAYAPTNEQGVVFLFGRLAPQIGFQAEEANTRFPDFVGWYRGQRRKIEVEFRSSNYKGHPPKGADLIVCWENDWEHRPKKYQHLEILELKQYVGALPRVFMVGCDEKVRGEFPDHYKRIHWSVPSKAQVGDLILLYRKAPAAEIRDLWKVTGQFMLDKTWGLEADLHRLVRLEHPVTYRELKSDPHTRHLGVVRQSFQGKRDITDEWALLYAKILSKNPGAKAALRDYAPD
jgi:hypothetical protein